jgi:hypothetical protein
MHNGVANRLFLQTLTLDKSTQIATVFLRASHEDGKENQDSSGFAVAFFSVGKTSNKP